VPSAQAWHSHPPPSTHTQPIPHPVPNQPPYHPPTPLAAGTKRWTLYKPQHNHALPNQPSGDLQLSELGPPLQEVVLEPGDVLYLPRGMVHQAAAQQGESSHITISTYQRWSMADFAVVSAWTGWPGWLLDSWLAG
jgi:hypothetical protein